MDIQSELDELAHRAGVTGASLAILEGDDLQTYATGLANAETRLPVMPEHRFLIGSTSKVYTAVLVMQLVDQRLIDLDAPVRQYVPDLKLDGDAAIDNVTVGQLLSHTSGIDNGPYADFGRGAAAIDEYVEALSDIPLIDSPGQRFSYSNAAFVLAGLLIERVTGELWEDALASRILQPAGLSSSHTDLRELIVRPVAVPHVLSANGEVVVKPLWGIAGRAMGPTGTTLATTASDLAQFAAVASWHKGPGSLLSSEAREQMTIPLVALPPGLVYAQACGLGWFHDRWSGETVLGHTGHNGGSGSYLRVIPERRIAIALLFNSPGRTELYHPLYKRILSERYGVEKPDPWFPIESINDLSLESHTGTYLRHDFRLRLEGNNGALQVVEAAGQAEHLFGQVLRPANERVFGFNAEDAYQIPAPDGYLSPNIVFSGFQAGRPSHLYTAVFAARRV